MKKILTTSSLIIALMVFLAQSSTAQYVMKEADEQYRLFNYSKAIDLYAQAFKKQKTLHAAQQLADSYRLMHDYKNAESWYAITIALPEARLANRPENILRYAEALQNNSKYSEAKEQYLSYLVSSKAPDEEYIKRLMRSCDSAIKWMKQPGWVNITNEKALNSDKSDWGWTQSGKDIVFTSDRIYNGKLPEITVDKPLLKFDGGDIDPSKKVYGWTGNSYLKLYQLDGDSAKLFPINTGTDYHIGPATFTADANEMFFSVTRREGKEEKDEKGTRTINIEIFSSIKDPATGIWGQPIAFPHNNASQYSTGDPYITPDGKTLYFVSDMEGGAGGTDIYYSTKNIMGGWDTPVNVVAVNTSGNERTPIVTADAMYFASDGRIGMGGLDIFKVSRAIGNNRFLNVENLRYPINSPQDDFAYVSTGKSSGYFSSERAGGAGSDDIYSFVERPKPVLAFRVEGTAIDKVTQAPLANSVITLRKNTGTTLIVETDETGRYKFDLDGGSTYLLTGEKTSYMSDNQGVTTAGLTESLVIKKDLFLSRIELNKEIRLENIYYDLDKADIRPDAAVELNKLIRVLKDNPTIWIELGSHTDSRASTSYNKDLSQRRADAAVNYIINVGKIDRNRITAKGYGESRLVNGCKDGVSCTVDQHQQNRRTEFTIVKQ
ncbi:MAG: flagellar motor protein MotB [Sphingobacteriaceae bacterium]|nr:MAG: flagellar motor protein MotB [Sphingobacteriaceae bacterium]